MHGSALRRILSAEYLVAAILVAIFYVTIAGFDWYWLFILFILFDISAVGYFINPRAGALGYNIGHSLIGPTLLAGLYIMTDNRAVLFIALLWLFHIFSDRALGFGLKHSDSFWNTHMVPIGRDKH